MAILRKAALFSLLTLAVSAQGVRTEFMATFAGQRLPGSRVCFFPASADDGFFQKFLSSTDVRCLDGDAVIDMPVGNWNIFLTHPDGYTSTHPTFQSGNTETAEDRAAYRASIVQMYPAASVRFAGTPAARPVVYFPNSDPDQPATIRPLLPGAREVLVPAAPVVPLLVEGTRIVRIGELLTPAPGAVVTTTFSAPPAAHRDVVALLRLPFDEYDEALDELDVYLEIDGRRYKPLVAPRLGHALDRSLLLFRHVPNKQSTVTVSGTRWKTLRIPVPATSGEVHTVEAPVPLQRTGEVTVRWQYPPVLPGKPCRMDRPVHEQSSAAVSIEACADETTCQVIEERRLDREPTSGSLTFDGLEAGEYRLTLRDPRFGAASGTTGLRRGETRTVALTLAPVAISGTVRLGDSALSADVSFLTGHTTTDTNGTYVALLPRAPGLETVTVLPCDGSQEYVAIPNRPLEDGAIFDIQVPATELRTDVRDAFTGAALGGASVSVAVLFGKEDVERFYLDAPATDPAGTTTLYRLPTGAWIRVCASHQGFKSRCSETFLLAADEKKHLSLNLTAENARAGRLLTDGPILIGRLYWVRPDGTVSETRAVGEDGTFTYILPHPPPEHVVFTSANRPLAILPAIGDAEIRLPRVPVRDVLITPSGVTNARIALEIDGYLVPASAFAQHQMMRGQPAAIHGGAAMRVAEIVAQQLVVLAGPPTTYLPPGTPPGTDSATIPHFHALFKRIPAAGANVELRP